MKDNGKIVPVSDLKQLDERDSLALREPQCISEINKIINQLDGYFF